MAVKLGIGHYHLSSDRGPARNRDGARHLPIGAVAALDLTTGEQRAARKVGQNFGSGIFLFGDDSDTKEFVADGGTILSVEDPRDGTPDGNGLDAIAAFTGYRPSGNRWSECLFDLFTAGGDPLNQTGNWILVPRVNRVLELVCGGVPLHSRWFDPASDPHWDKLRVQLAEKLDRARDLALARKLIDPISRQIDEAYHLKVAGAMVEKYAGQDPQKQAALFDDVAALTEWDSHERPVKPGTVISDNFNGSDSATPGKQLSWTESGWTVQPDKFENYSNELKGTGYSQEDRYLVTTSSLATADHYSQVVVADGDGADWEYQMVMCRVNAVTDDNYLIYRGATGYDETVYLYVTTSGPFALTQIATGEGIGTPSRDCPILIRLETDGSTITAYTGGVLACTTSDGAVTDGYLTGVGIENDEAVISTFDDFEAGDLHPQPPRTMHQFRQRRAS